MMDNWTGWHRPPADSNPSGNGYQFALGSMMGQMAAELRNMHLGTAMELRTLRTETVTELRALRDSVSTAAHLAQQLLREERATKGSGLMAQISNLLKLLLPYAILVMVVAGKLTWKDMLPVVRTYLTALGVSL